MATPFQEKFNENPIWAFLILWPNPFCRDPYSRTEAFNEILLKESFPFLSRRADIVKIK